MKKHFLRTVLALAMALCLLTGAMTVAGATQAQPSDFDVLKPLMDLVATAAETAGDEPEVVGNEETTLSSTFIARFLSLASAAGDTFGVTADMLASADQQAAYLPKVFAAKLPELTAITPSAAANGYIGFQPVTVNTGSDSDVQIIGELYYAAKPMSEMSDTDYRDIQWLDRAVFSFRSDANALNGYLMTGFSVGSELNMEEAMQTYTDTILVEYFKQPLGFSILYPSVFTDDMLVEDDTGVSAKLPDSSVSFFVRRTDNTANSNLKDYVDVIANGIANAKAAVDEELQSATVAYETADGYLVHDVYIVTDKYVYQAELSYKKELASTYQMYTLYLDNSFSVDEVSVG